MFEVEKNIPIPERVRMKYPWEQLGIGDSFLIPDAIVDSVRSGLYSCARNMKIKVTLKTVDGGMRVWRIK